MADEIANDFDPQLFGLIASLHQTAMIEMGKLMNPGTGKAERRLDGAQRTIDLLSMLQRKTEGNLTKAEKEYLDHVLYELRMNYLDESESPASSTESSEGGSTPAAEEKAESEPEAGTDEARG